MKKKIHTYNILLSNGEWLENIRFEGPLEYHFSGVMVSLLPVKDAAGKTIVLNMYHIVKAELLTVEEIGP
ncbi:hypothetical protein [Planococcus halotolerans]|uniref:Uncharacterized protein n=1 Tax=Planococcus halotolerans TaxID=2233542 RepID=A0A365KQU5_9BACL|nr:hypothetical protein [Planococcus halotolerans]QHJ69525.1 hypothetical protein DNR44_002265 [Planococcus halotolerans]RAZ75475.1 hypothetical protein DP120_13975 [Planococcus halotolerans]